MTFFKDTWIVFSRAMRLSLQNPLWVIIGISQPILYLALFGPLLQAIAGAPGFPPGDAWQIFVPGLLVQLGVFGGFFVGFGIIAEWRAGVIERMLVSPASRTALIAGRVLRDVIVLIVQAIILVVCAMFFGLSVPFIAIVLGLIIIAMLGASASFFSYAMALAVKSEDAFAPIVNSIALPILLLSGILLPMSLAPVWLQTLSDINPFKHVVTAIRAVFRNEIVTGEVGLGVGIAIALVLIAAFVGTRSFANQTK
ncbi:ABC transporter permease [Cucumibacter marinus]|uniref:ABC transporter permease n=1 Tax=Cucumibacter marinus TaxID=1121252 RepID=UPI0004005DC8|nr:ABC transporter permease [Cucumibacter marinus]